LWVGAVDRVGGGRDVVGDGGDGAVDLVVDEFFDQGGLGFGVG
jgi:hypothetical protein